MSKRLIVSVVAVCALFAAVVSMASEEGQLAILKPAAPGQKSDAIPITKQDLANGRVMKILSDNRVLSKSMGVIDTLTSPIGISVNFGSAPGDTMACYFDPPAACYIKSVGILTQDWSGQFNDGFNLLIFKSNVDPTTLPPDSVDGNGWMGRWSSHAMGCPTGDWCGSSWGVPPQGALMWGEFPCIAVDGEWIWTDMIWLGYEPDSEGEPFFVAYAPFGTPGQNFGTSAGDATDYIEWRGFKYYHDGGTSGHGGWHWRHYGWIFYVVVEFYENTAPKIIPAQHLHTFSPGPYTMTAEITDIDASDETQAGVASAFLHYSVDGGVTYDSLAMSGPAAGGTFTVDIPAGTLPTKARTYYYVSATDPPGLYASTSPPRSFYVGETTPGEDFLYVNASGDYGATEDTVYQADLAALVDWDCDYIPGPCDETVWLLPQYTTILFNGDGRAVYEMIPNTGPSKLKDFLDAGGNLLIWSDELIGNYYEWPSPDDIVTTAEGDFIHDYLHVVTAESDGPIHNMLDVPEDGLFDSLTDTIRYSDPTGADYGDCVAPDEAAVGILVQADSLEGHEPDGGKYTGIKYEGAYKVAFFPLIFSGFDTNTRGVILRDILEWFGTVKTGVEPVEIAGIPTVYSLTQNYPNPFNPETIIEYAIPKASDVKVSVFNLLGQKVAELVNKRQESGKYKVTLDAKNLASGVYFYRLQAGDFTLTKKMLVLK